MRGRIPKRGLGLGSAVRRIRELRGVGQEILAERSGLSQGYLSQIESGAWTGITEDVLGRIARALGVEPWVILAQAAGLKLDQVERFSDDERRWLDAFRALDPEQPLNEEEAPYCRSRYRNDAFISLHYGHRDRRRVDDRSNDDEVSNLPEAPCLGLPRSRSQNLGQLTPVHS